MGDVKQLKAALNEFVVKESNVITTRMYTGVREKTPVDTGHAKNSWRVVKRIVNTGEHALINNDAAYIGWLNFGTPKMAAHHMVERTIQEVQKDYR